MLQLYRRTSFRRKPRDYNKRVEFVRTHRRDNSTHMRSRRAILPIIASAAVILIGAGRAAAQPAPDKPLLSDQVFKNVQVLKGIPVDDFMETMGIMTAALQ